MLSENVDGVDIVNCSCLSLVILSVLMYIRTLYYTTYKVYHSIQYIEFTCNARSIDDHICICTIRTYVTTVCTCMYVQIYSMC